MFFFAEKSLIDDIVGGMRTTEIPLSADVTAGGPPWLEIPDGVLGTCRTTWARPRPSPIHRPMTLCPLCDGAPLDRRAYSYLLGLYLGDGYVNQARRFITIACFSDYIELMDLADQTLTTVMPTANTRRYRRTGNFTEVTSYSRHWSCLFPQCGRGKKQDRRITLADWQQAVVDHHPWPFICGLIHSDGCRVTTTTRKRAAGGTTEYDYDCYFFSNRSDDIHRLLQRTLDRVGVEWTRSSFKQTSIRKRASVALLDLHVGPKF